MGEGFSVLQGTKAQSSLYFVTQQGGKRPGQMASYGWEYSVLLCEMETASLKQSHREAAG